MVEQAAEDYARMLLSLDPNREINPICVGIDDMLARLDEFETLLSSVKADSNIIMENNIRRIIGYDAKLTALRSRIEKLEKCVNIINENVAAVENSVDIAECELNVTDYSIKGLLLKPLLAKAKGGEGGAEPDNRTNLQDGVFQPVQIFSSNELFGNRNFSVNAERPESE